jgi:MFS family permease
MATYVFISIGSALFHSASGGIVSQIVEREKLQSAMQQSQAVNSFAGIIGGILGGAIISFSGVLGAFLFDSISFVIATIATNAIKSNTIPLRAEPDSGFNAFKKWKNDLFDGFKILYKMPVMFWICIIAMLMNLSLSPLGIVLPVLTKESRNMPAWFLGALESSISLGAIVGAVTFSAVQKRIKMHYLIILSITMIGIGVIVLPWVPNVALPLSVLFWIGIGSTWASIPIGTQVSLTIPDSHRGRIGSIMGFLCSGISPIGIAATGILISNLGLTHSLLIMGVVLILLAPLMLLIPKFKEFVGASQQEAEGFVKKYYPDAL